MPKLIRTADGDVVGINVPALKLLRDAVQKVQLRRSYQPQGICSNVDHHTRWMGVDGYDAVKFLAVGWEHAELAPNGQLEVYFVPHNIEYGLWAGPNGRLRQDCLTYILRRIEDMLKAQEKIIRMAQRMGTDA